MERTTTSTERRFVVRGLLGIVAGGSALAPRQVAASRGWCRVDPVVRIDGRLAEILVAVKFVDIYRMNGPTEIVVTVPKGVDAKLVTPGIWQTRRGDVSGPGFGHGEITRFAESRKLKRTRDGVQMEISVLVPSRKTHRVRVEFGRPGRVLLDPKTAKGTTNKWVTLRTTF